MRRHSLIPHIILALAIAAALLLACVKVAWGDTCENRCEAARIQCSNSGGNTCEPEYRACLAKCKGCDGAWQKQITTCGGGVRCILNLNARYWRCVDRCAPETTSAAGELLAGAEGPTCGKPPLPPCQPKQPTKPRLS